MSRPWQLVTPASRGIGLALTRHLLRTTPYPVLATARSDFETARRRMLEGLDVDPDRLYVRELDVTHEDSIQAVADECHKLFPSSKNDTQQSHHLRLAFMIPGILHPEKRPEQIDAQLALQTFQVNAVGPLLLAKHFLPFLPRSTTKFAEDDASEARDSTQSSDSGPLPSRAVMAFMGARVGSISDNRLGGWFSYRASKAAVAQIARSMDIQLQARSAGNACAIAMHPGTVKTALSDGIRKSDQGHGIFDADEAAANLVRVVRRLNLESDRGKVWDWAGKEVPP